MRKEKLKILYEDKYLVAVDKPAKLLTISTELEKENTLYHQVASYLKTKNKNNKIFIVHRLDKDTSGIVLFAKNEKIKKMLQDNWDDVTRLYTALVHGKLESYSGTIKSYLKENKDLFVYSTNDKRGKLAITNYEVITCNDKYSLVRIEIKTGRKNQIRVHMNDIGHPIVGDKKYGKLKTSAKRLYLHASSLEFVHPITKEVIEITSDVDNMFLALVN